MPRVLLDLTPLVTPSSLRGIGRYVRGLVQGLLELGSDPELSIEGCAANDELSNLELVTDLAEYCGRDAKPPVAFARDRRSILICRAAPRFVLDRPGLLHLTDPKGVPWSRPEPYCLTCHDLIPIVLHEQYLPPIPGWDRLYAAIERFRYRRAARILAVSHATKRDLCTKLDIDESRVDVAWHGVDHTRYHPRAEEGERSRLQGIVGDANSPYVLYLGAGDARKDLGTLIAAFAESRARREARLVIAGHLSPSQLEKLVMQSRALGVESELSLPGYVDERLVPALYRNAAVHVFASRYEGFGLPVLEALACGAPTITSPGSSLDEVAGDAALIVPVGEPEALREGVDRLFFDDEARTRLRERGLARALTFTWRSCAENTKIFWKKALQPGTLRLSDDA
jgi:glycosyltransferase involved in cell wall biosynthesis